MPKTKILFNKKPVRNIPFLSPIAKSDPNLAQEIKKVKKTEEIGTTQTQRRRIKHLYRTEAAQQQVFENALASYLSKGDLKGVDRAYDIRIKELTTRGEHNTELISNYKEKEKKLTQILKQITTKKVAPKNYVDRQYTYSGNGQSVMAYGDPAVAYIAEHLRDKWNNDLSRDAMVGVMITENGTCYVTISGKTSDQNLSDEIDIPGIQLDQVVFVGDSRIGLDMASTDTKVSIKVGSATVEVDAPSNGIIGCCAAPKLWVYAINHGHVPLAFSEYKTDGDQKQRESCDNCKALMPKLLKATQTVFKNMEAPINQSFKDDVKAIKKRKQQLEKMITEGDGQEQLKNWNLVLKHVDTLVEYMQKDIGYDTLKSSSSNDQNVKNILLNTQNAIGHLNMIKNLMHNNNPLAIERLPKRKEAINKIKLHFQAFEKFFYGLINKQVTYIVGQGWVNKKIERIMFSGFDKSQILITLKKEMQVLAEVVTT